MVFVLIKRAGEQKLVPQFVDFNAVSQAISIHDPSNYTGYTPQKILDNDGNDMNFRKRISNHILFGLIPSIMISLLLIIARFIVNSYNPDNDDQNSLKKKIFRAVVQGIRHQSSISLLISIIFEGSIAFLTFNCFIQLQQPSYLNPLGKLNMFLLINVLFASLLFSTSFYILIYAKLKP